MPTVRPGDIGFLKRLDSALGRVAYDERHLLKSLLINLPIILVLVI